MYDPNLNSQSQSASPPNAGRVPEPSYSLVPGEYQWYARDPTGTSGPRGRELLLSCSPQVTLGKLGFFYFLFLSKIFSLSGEVLYKPALIDPTRYSLGLVGGGGTASLNEGRYQAKILPRCPCFSALFVSFLLPPPIPEGHRPPPSKIKHSQCKIIYKSHPILFYRDSYTITYCTK